MKTLDADQQASFTRAESAIYRGLCDVLRETEADRDSAERFVFEYALDETVDDPNPDSPYYHYIVFKMICPRDPDLVYFLSFGGGPPYVRFGVVHDHCSIAQLLNIDLDQGELEQHVAAIQAVLRDIVAGRVQVACLRSRNRPVRWLVFRGELCVGDACRTLWWPFGRKQWTLLSWVSA